MKKIIQKKTYNTDTAEKIKTKTFGEYGDASGFEEALYKTPKGDYFLYGYGGPLSKYPEETLIPLSPEEAEKF